MTKRRLGKIGVVPAQKPASKEVGICRDCRYSQPARIGGSPGTQCMQESSLYHRWFSIDDQLRSCEFWQAAPVVEPSRKVNDVFRSNEPLPRRGTLPSVPERRQQRLTVRNLWRLFGLGRISRTEFADGLIAAGLSTDEIESVVSGEHRFVRRMRGGVSFGRAEPTDTLATRAPAEPVQPVSESRERPTPTEPRNESPRGSNARSSDVRRCSNCSYNVRGRCQHPNMRNISVTAANYCHNHDWDFTDD